MNTGPGDPKSGPAGDLPWAQPGHAAPLGASPREGGVNLVVWAPDATAVVCCLFDATGTHETQRLRLHGPGGGDTGLWTGFLPGAGPGLVYGLRAWGPWEPAQGHRFNPHKLLLDPAAREIVGRFDWRPEHHAYVLGQGTDTFDTRDNAAWALKARVAPPPAGGARPPRPRVPAGERVLLELHVKGFSRLHPDIPEPLRGTYAGLAHPACIAHIRRLGVTTLSLLPVQQRISEPMMPPGLVNHWGYNTVGFFCPDPRFAQQPDDPSAVAAEFRAMVDTLHAHGLEVVLDVVYNHTPEGNEHGPSISWRGLAGARTYRHGADGRQLDWSHCGNTVDVSRAPVRQWVLASLRHWVQDMGVDGFRFDLAPVLGRDAEGRFDAAGDFFTALRQDPVLADAVLIAEPWDGGPVGYQVGGFPPPWAEWNDRFRDAARGFWLGRDAPHGADGARGPVSRREFAARFTGSADVYRHAGRAPTASINFVTCHDGYTLADLVSYATKHNHANGEGNRDGRDDELCANFGHEGPSDDPAVNAPRTAVQRALLATLLLAHGTPMLTAGDDFGHTQGGNNNAWNQDNAIGWLDWTRAATPEGRALADLVARLGALRREHPLLRPSTWAEAPLRWLALDDPAHALVLHLGADGAGGLLLAFNPDPLPLPLPPGVSTGLVLLDTAGCVSPLEPVAPRSLRLLQAAPAP